MRVLRRTWPVASALFLALGLGMAWAGSGVGSSTPVTTSQPTHFQLLGKTWCMGGQPAAVHCDFALPAARPAPARNDDNPFRELLGTLRRALGGDSQATARPEAVVEPDRG